MVVKFCPLGPLSTLTFMNNEYQQLLEERKQRILETLANMIDVSIRFDLHPKGDYKGIDIPYHSVLKILQENFHSYEIRNKP